MSMNRFRWNGNYRQGVLLMYMLNVSMVTKNILEYDPEHLCSILFSHRPHKSVLNTGFMFLLSSLRWNIVAVANQQPLHNIIFYRKNEFYFVHQSQKWNTILGKY